jgi:hypothetical protein
VWFGWFVLGSLVGFVLVCVISAVIAVFATLVDCVWDDFGWVGMVGKERGFIYGCMHLVYIYELDLYSTTYCSLRKDHIASSRYAN